MKKISKNSKSQSEIIGLVLIVGIVVLGIGIIVVVGNPTVEEQKTTTEMERAVSEFGLLDSRLSSAALTEDSVKGTEINVRRGEIATNPDSGWISMSIEYENGTTNDLLDEVPLGETKYTLKDETVAYQAGAIWRVKGDQNSTLVSPPDLFYRGETLTFPVIQIKPKGASGGDRQTLVATSSSSVAVHPTDTRRNPLEGEFLYVTIQSEYYQGWFEYLKDGIVDKSKISVDPSQKTVTVKFDIKEEDITVGEVFDSAIIARNDATLRGASGTDSYNDTSTGNSNGDVKYGGGLTKIGNAVDINGDERNEPSDHPPADDLILQMVESAKTNNDNSKVSCISGNAVTSDCTGGSQLDAGTYYLTDGNIGDDIDFDTSQGDVHLVVDGNFDLQGNHLFKLVNGDNKVNIYVNGDFTMGGGAEIRSINKEASRIRIYVKSGSTVTFSTGSSVIEGVLYAAGAHVEYKGNTEIWGSIIADSFEGRGSIFVHYDERLERDRDVLIPGIGDVRFLHTTKNPIDIEIR